MSENELKLYDIPRESKLSLEIDGKYETVTFHNLDGMYSYCTVDTGPNQGKVCHLAAWTPLRKINDIYMLDITRE